MKQSTRLTLICNDPKLVHYIINTNTKAEIINSYDIFAVRTGVSEQLFEQICTKADLDLVSLDLSQRLPFYLTKQLIKQALARGLYFELAYGGQCLEQSS
eukprot:CAMPEP_0202965864 /NCGR_PEP_ID=MMETSP1396-20130829/10008_1 /ASSEMBLY_ACC=CAM_ASM_000872 /TAXON_ID= /ORGANISM="Pseudokeronopsis sp., Strain Brazil" /LENGTH=99 /DNA_ID=CAMNT_0049689037 /DNA_START=223 /DNA_END=522 /DNA_ORIENTATION=+